MDANVRNLIRPFLLGLFLFCISCGGTGSVPVPDNLLPEEKMSEVLSDAHLAEASIQTFMLANRDSIAKAYYSQIFRIHEVEEEAYYSSLEYYGMFPEKLEGIYARTMEILQEKEKK